MPWEAALEKANRPPPKKRIYNLCILNDSPILNNFSLLTTPSPLVRSFSYQPVSQYLYAE